MNIDEITLRAYVDGELTPAERERVAAAIANNASLEGQVAAMQASVLPYRAAFDAQPMPAMPEALQRQLASLSAVAATSSAVNAQGASTARAASDNVVALPMRRRWLGTGLAFGTGIAAAFAAGWFVRPLLGTSTPVLNANASDALAPWVPAIASYQAMYVRATLEKSAFDPAQTRQALGEFQSANKFAASSAKISVPNLNAAGYDFRRAQLLGYGDKPLLQMAYLPAQGKPAALCVLPVTDGKELPLTVHAIEGMSVATWQTRGLSYVLAIDAPIAKVKSMGEQILRDGFPLLVAV
jgi:anti-sigma factor RsiW